MLFFAPGFYLDSDRIFSIVRGLDFIRMPYGMEIENFQMVSEEVRQGFCFLLSRNVRLSSGSGTFRVPYPVIHFEEPYECQIFGAAVALSETTFRLHRHLATGYISANQVVENLQGFVNDNCFDKSRWEEYAVLKMKPNDVVLYKPLAWHSFESEMIKWFGIEVDDA